MLRADGSVVIKLVHPLERLATVGLTDPRRLAGSPSQFFRKSVICVWVRLLLFRLGDEVQSFPLGACW